MNKAKITWRERTSKSKFVDSVWFCSAATKTTRTVFADPCISISLVKGDSTRVVLRGTKTIPRNEVLAPGYTCLTIRLQPGVILRGFPAQRFIYSAAVLPVDAEGWFWFEGTHLKFPDFDNAELLIDQLDNLGYLRREILSSNNEQAAKILSTRSYARLIKRTTGLSPYQLHQLQRIHKALRLLKQGLSAATVAAELNFVDQPHLTHATKQFLGHTPKQLLSLPQIS